MKRQQPETAKSQRDQFIETAREHGADMTEEQLKEALRKIAPKRKDKTPSEK